MTIPIAALLLVLQTGKGSIEGAVLSTMNTPIAGAQVTLIKTGAPIIGGGQPRVLTGVLIANAGVTGGTVGTQAGSPNSTTATTDSSGHFVFTDLDPANYLVQAAKDGYARQQFGPLPAGETGMNTSVSVAAGQAASGIVLHLIAAGNVSGRVTGNNGDPLVGMDVSALRVTYTIGGRRNFTQAGSAQTNDKGEYRLFWITPGKYYLSVSASNRPLAGMPLSSRPANKYAQTFYPGVTDVAVAAEVEIASGGELNGMDFRLQEHPVFRVRGHVVDASTGQAPKNASISITPREQIGGGIFSSSSPYNGTDGSFELRDVIPGSYWVRAQLPLSAPFQPGGPPPRPPLGMAAVDVSASDVDNVVITILPPQSIAGRIRFDGQSAVPLDRIRVSLQLGASGPLLGGGLPQAAVVNPDGTFVIQNVSEGEYQVSVLGLGTTPAGNPAGTTSSVYVREARFGGVDVLTEQLKVYGQVSADLQIVVASDSGQVSGTVTDDRQQRVAQGIVVLVPDARERRDLYRTQPLSAGAFTITNVVPGNYVAFALDPALMQLFFDPAVIQRLTPSGKAINVPASQNANVDLRLISTVSRN